MKVKSPDLEWVNGMIQLLLLRNVGVVGNKNKLNKGEGSLKWNISLMKESEPIKLTFFVIM